MSGCGGRHDYGYHCLSSHFICEATDSYSVLRFIHALLPSALAQDIGSQIVGQELATS